MYKNYYIYRLIMIIVLIFLQPGTGRNCKEINSIRSMSSTILFRWNCKWIYEKYFSCHNFCTPFKLLSNSLNNNFYFRLMATYHPLPKKIQLLVKQLDFAPFRIICWSSLRNLTSTKNGSHIRYWVLLKALSFEPNHCFLRNVSI